MTLRWAISSWIRRLSSLVTISLTVPGLTLLLLLLSIVLLLSSLLLLHLLHVLRVIHVGIILLLLCVVLLGSCRVLCRCSSKLCCLKLLRIHICSLRCTGHHYSTCSRILSWHS